MEKQKEGRESKKGNKNIKKGQKKKKENECGNRKAGKGKSIVQTNVESSKTLDVALVIDHTHTHTHDVTHVIGMGRGIRFYGTIQLCAHCVHFLLERTFG